KVRIVRADGAQVELMNYSGLSNTTASLRRDAGCGEGFTNGPPAPRNSASTLKVCGAVPPPARELTISQIQGAGLKSPYEGEYVVTRGVVTQRKGNGFYIESEAGEDDQNPETSEGLFIFTRTAPVAEAAVGKLVRVTGTVMEFNTVTELAEPQVEILGDGGLRRLSLGQAALSPASRLEELERFEGMQWTLLRLAIVQAAGGTINDASAIATSNGIAWAVASEFPVPATEPAVADGNPERLRLDGVAGSRMGERTYATGALDFADGAWSIVVREAFGVDFPRDVRPALPPTPQELTLATFNLRRFFDDRDDAGVSDPVLTPEAFERRLTKTALHITNLLHSPDILAVQEVDNLNALEQLARKLGASWRAYVQEGNDSSGIDVGFLVNTARVTVQSVTQLEKVDPIHDRPPLLLRATSQGVAVAVLTVHQRSLINAGDAAVRQKRQAQADAVARIAAGLHAENAVILGDFNAHPFDDGNGAMLQPLLDAGYVRLGSRLPIEVGYTYIEDGQLQELDHVFVSPAMNTRLSRYEVAHTNTPFPVIDFNLTSEPQRASDHDVPLARFRLEATPPAVRGAGLVSAATLLNGEVAPKQLATLFGGGFTANTRVLFGETPAAIFFRSAGQLNFTVPDLPSETALVQVVDSGSTLASFEVRTRFASPGLFTQTGSGLGAAAALNQDNTLNTQANPAARGSVVQLYGTGLREDSGAQALIGGRVAQVLYASQAPGLVEGAAQINAVVPETVVPGPAEVLVTAGSATSRRGVHIWVK
ncbi:MAG: endonuclease/exonuclease/phosphatase family protein, partial [Acidobacteria bacterium]|nr:endonuclease/exonuclease/phosphatase family protein [Acidobacteriota bacterium]